MDANARIYVAGHTGLLGSAIVRCLLSRGFSEIILRTRTELDLTNQEAVRLFFDRERPDYVFLAAAKVGSIAENIKYPLEFLNENILIQKNVFAAAHSFKVKKLLFFSSNCCYPKDCIQPMKEEYFMTGPLEPTNEAFALAKIVGMKLCQNYNFQFGTQFDCVVPASLYGPNDHFGTSRAHVVADMIHKLYKAKIADNKKIVFWGDGSPRREYMFVDDSADAALFLMENDYSAIDKNQRFINVGTGEEVSMFDLSLLISEVIGYIGKINWDISKPNGMPRKLLDSGKINAMGWQSRIKLREGIEKTYQWYLKNI